MTPNTLTFHWRDLLIARLMGERAQMLGSLISLDEATLSDAIIYENWHIKDLLAHIGRWDEHETRRMIETNAGRPYGVSDEDVNRLNASWHEQDKSLSLEQGLAVYLKARGGLMTALKHFTDEEVSQLHTVNDSISLTIKSLTELEYEHDEEHAVEVLKWRKENSNPRAVGPKYLLRAYLQATRKEFLSVAALVPEAERATRPVCGEWTLKDVIGHVADWNQYGVDSLQQIIDGAAEITNPYGSDIQAWNEAHAAARKNDEWHKVWDDLAAANEQLLNTLDQCPQEDLARKVKSPWSDRHLIYAWFLIWANHEREHAADLRRTLNLPDIPAHLLPHE